MVMTQTARMTAAEYFVAEPESDRHTELIDGVVYVSEARWRHQRTAGLVYRRLWRWIENGGHGAAGIPIDVTVNQYNVYAPDVWWVADPDRLDPDELFVGLPDLVVEVRSPSTWTRDKGIKRRRYEETGLPELWLVDTKNEVVTMLRRSDPVAPTFDVQLDVVADGVLSSPQLPGFGLSLREVFLRA